ncbi:MAG: hypothetical protein L0099_08080, partial [Acidobacteria bacterium]|nr:hypothetical protein [Acidobacteriota bacterium]
MPPHSLEAERGVLGCVLLAGGAHAPGGPAELLRMVRERLGGDGANVFYDLRHREIFTALCGLSDDGIGIDLITLQERLRSHQKLDAVGGLASLSALPDEVPGAAMLEDYLGIVWDKYLARCVVQESVKAVETVYTWEGAPEGLWGQLARQREELLQKSHRGTGQPRFLKSAGDFAEECWARFFGGQKETPGRSLPIEFKLKIRPGETTLVTGDDGCGKSTVLSYFALHLAAQGEKVMVASFEMPPAVSLWIMVSQLMGTKWLPDSREGERKLQAALGWLASKVWFYDFLGIGDYRDVLDTFRFAAERLGVSVEVLDSVMRIGIADDDYAQQGFAA